MKCHKIATPKKMKRNESKWKRRKKEKNNTKRTPYRNWQNKCVHTCYLFFLRYSNFTRRQQKKPIPFELKLLSFLQILEFIQSISQSFWVDCDNDDDDDDNEQLNWIFPIVHTMYFLIQLRWFSHWIQTAFAVIWASIANLHNVATL